MKPKVFFSHSSFDKDRIKPIKDHILEKTGNAIQIFMSSDGASIPFGTNWLREIEVALTTCKLMFVWLTPNSAKNNWIYFESGYAYSQNIKVVPIGFDGIKLEELPAPLNLLQGFNINSAYSLNNIIAIINKEFSLTFSFFFDEVFYDNVVSKLSSENSPELLEYVNTIKCTFHPSIKYDADNFSLRANWVKIFKEVLEEKGEIFTQRKAEFYGMGYKINLIPHDKNPYPEILIDPISLNNILNILYEMNNNIYEPNYNTLILSVDLTTDYYIQGDHFLVSARLMNTEVDFKTSHPYILYRYRNILFRINNRKNGSTELVLLIDCNNNGKIPLLSLVKLLVKQRIIKRIFP